jgi:hypothetical protein
LTPKPSYEALRKLIKEKWWTDEKVATGVDGVARLRGARGEYRITVTAGDRTPVIRTMRIAKGEANRIVVNVTQQDAADSGNEEE